MFVRDFGQEVEDACGLAVQVSEEILYLSRSEVLSLIPAPIHFVARGTDQGLLRSDPVNQLLSDIDDSWDKSELDLTSLPVVRSNKKKAQASRTKRNSRDKLR